MNNLYIECLGTGSAFNHKYGNTSLLVDGIDGKLLLCDCGYDVPAKLSEQQLKNLKYVYISHCHADHMGGLEELLWKCRHLQVRPVLLCSKEVADILETMLDYGLTCDNPDDSGLCAFFHEVKHLDSQYTVLGAAENYAAKVVPVHHCVEGLPATMLVIEDRTETIRFIYTGDMSDYNRTHLDLFKKANIVFHEMTMSNELTSVHYALGFIGEDYEDCQDKIVLIHYDTTAEEVRETLADTKCAAIRVAEPGMIFRA